MRRFLTPAGVSTLFVAIVLALAAAPARAAEAVRSSWRCLPPETCLAFRVPNGQAFLDAVRAQTKFGAVILNQERLDKLTNAVTEDNKEEWEKMKGELAKYDLKVEDWKAFANGEIGFGLTVVKRGKKSPLPVMLVWSEPSGDLAARMFKAIQKSHDENKDKPGADKRVDLKIEGLDVMRFTSEVHGVNHDFDADEVPENFDEMTPEQRQEWFKQQRAKRAEVKGVAVDQNHVMLARMGNRILLAMTIPSSQKDVQEAQAKPEAKIDLDALTGLEELTGTFARFIKAHSDKDDKGGATAALLATPGLSEALPAGVPLVELLADIRPILKLIPNEGPNDMGPRVVKAMGFDKIGPVGVRMSLDKTVLRTGGFVSAPAPRTGILALLDQPTLKPEIPEWVPATALTYTHVSMDLGKAYLKIKELVLGEFGQEAGQGFQMIEGQAQQMLNVELSALLSGFGQQHSIIEYEAKKKAPPAEKKHAEGEEEEEMMMPEGPQASMAVVWQVKDEELMKKFLQTAMAMTGAAEPADEQGFTGYRAPAPIEGGVFVGRNFMTLSLGQGVTEATLLNLRTPPKGKDAMKETDAVKRGATLVQLQPGLMYSASDANRAAKKIRDAFVEAVDRGIEEAMAGRGRRFRGGQPENAAGDEEKARAMAAKIKELMPTDAELEGVLGASVGQMIVTEKGLVTNSAVEMPAPTK